MYIFWEIFNQIKLTSSISHSIQGNLRGSFLYERQNIKPRRWLPTKQVAQPWILQYSLLACLYMRVPTWTLGTSSHPVVLRQTSLSKLCQTYIQILAILVSTNSVIRLSQIDKHYFGDNVRNIKKNLAIHFFPDGLKQSNFMSRKSLLWYLGTLLPVIGVGGGIHGKLTFCCMFGNSSIFQANKFFDFSVLWNRSSWFPEELWK